MYSVELLEDLLELLVEAVVTQNADCFQGPHLSQVLHVHIPQSFLEGLTWSLIEDQTGPKDLGAVLVGEAEVEELRRSLLKFEHHSRWKTKLLNFLRERVIISIGA